MIDLHPDSRHSRSARTLTAFFQRGGTVSCPMCRTNCELMYQTELTARFRCRRVHQHAFSLPISLFS